MIKNCIICNGEFNTNLKRQVCCSKLCSKKYSLIQQRKNYNEKEKKQIKKNCIYCNKEFITSKLHENKCSQECREKHEQQRLKNEHYYKKKELVEQICKICKNIFITNKSYKYTCSKKCQTIYKIQYQLNWYDKNRQDINNRLQARNKIKWHSNKEYREKIKLCTGIRNRIAIYGWKKQSNTYDLIGCSYKDFIAYIEKQFKPGMTWENHGLKGWHADHIKPLALFDLSKKEEQLKAFNYKNYQPLWAKENLQKGKKY